MVDGEAHGVREVAHWLSLLDSDEGHFRRQAQVQLDRLCYPTIRGLVPHSEYERQAQEIGRSGIALSLREALRSGGPRAQAYAASWLGLYKDEDDIGKLIAALESKHADVRRAAASALKFNNDQRAIDPLIAAMQDMDQEVATAAAYALGSIRHGAALPPLLEWARHQNWKQRQVALSALANYDHRLVVEAARQGMRDPKSQVRKAAKYTLGSIEVARRHRRGKS